jgi:hypothetical protein
VTRHPCRAARDRFFVHGTRHAPHAPIGTRWRVPYIGGVSAVLFHAPHAPRHATHDQWRVSYPGGQSVFFMTNPADPVRASKSFWQK